MQRVTKFVLAGASLATLGMLAVPRRDAAKPLPQTLPLAAQPTAGEPVAKSSALLPEAARRFASQRLRTAQLSFARDPFRALRKPQEEQPRSDDVQADPAPSAPEPPLPLVQGISILGDDRRALVGGELLQEGDRLSSGVRIQRIERGSITVEVHGRTEILYLGEPR